MSTLDINLVANDKMKEQFNGEKKEEIRNATMTLPTENRKIDKKLRKKDKKEKARLDVDKRKSEQNMQESATSTGTTNGKTAWQQQFANPADMIYKAVELNNQIHSTKDSMIEHLRKALEEKYHENETLKEEMAKLQETSAKMLQMPSNAWDRQLLLVSELMKTVEITGKEHQERENTIKWLEACIEERDGMIVTLAEELSLAKGAIFQHLSKLEKIRATTFDAAQ